MRNYLLNLNIKGYSLCLEDGNNWRIDCDEYNMPMVDKMANIMRLKVNGFHDSPKLVFLKADEDKASGRYGDEGWKCHNAKSKNFRIWRHPVISDVVCEVGDKDQDEFKYLVMWYSLQAIYNRSVNLKGVPFHAGLAELDGRGVLFSASGGTGKSTTCRRLPKHWKPLCDDETLVVLDSNGEYRAHPFPTWSDYLMNRAPNTWNVQYSVPVSAIFFLEQADHDEVMPLTASEASIQIMESASQVCIHTKTLYKQHTDLIEFRAKLFNNAFNMATNTPAFRLRISLNGKFWEKVEKTLKRET